MKPFFLMMALFFCFAANCDARAIKSEEKHASGRACQKAIEQYTEDTQNKAYKKSEIIKVRRLDNDVIHIEQEAITEELYCEGRTAHHVIREK